jgi:hypothetical protein
LYRIARSPGVGAYTANRKFASVAHAQTHASPSIRATRGAAGGELQLHQRLETGRWAPNVAMLRKLAGALGVSYNELVTAAGYMDPPEAEDEAAADGRWFAGLPRETRRWLRQVVEGYPK